MGEGIIVLLFIMSLVLTIVWVILPFIIMGVNTRLDKVINLLSEQQIGNTSGASKSAAVSERPAEKASNKGSEEVKPKQANTMEAVVVLIVILFAIMIMAWAFA